MENGNTKPPKNKTSNRKSIPVIGKDPYKLVFQPPHKEVRAMQMRGGVSVETIYYDGNVRQLSTHFIPGGIITKETNKEQYHTIS